MPPNGMPKPSANELGALLEYVEGEFDRADRATKPHPGRVIAHRLNRTEYAKSIRDLLGVDYRARMSFPPTIQVMVSITSETCSRCLPR